MYVDTLFSEELIDGFLVAVTVNSQNRSVQIRERIEYSLCILFIAEMGDVTGKNDEVNSFEDIEQVRAKLRTSVDVSYCAYSHGMVER
jgi:hypothetical protein